MEDICKDIQEQMPELLSGTLPAERGDELRRHVGQCPACGAYLQALRADDRLLSDFGEAMQPTVRRLEDNVLDALNRRASDKPAVAASGWGMIFKGSVIRLGAAAVLLIAASYIAGRLSAPPPVDVEQLHANLEASLRSSLEPAIQEGLLEELNHRWQIVLASNQAQFRDGFSQLRNELAEQQSRDMGVFAVKTLYASNVVTNQLLRDLTRAIAAVQTRDRRLVATALSQIESNRLNEGTRLKKSLATLAVHTASELRRTKSEVAELLISAQPGGLDVDIPETLDERSEE
jgi:hypothetical protein